MNCLVNSINSLWILDIFYKLCLILDSIIYTVAGWLFNTFYEIAGMSIVNDFPAFLVVIDRFKLLVGIFALFILVKSLLTNLIDPDKAVVESGKIVKNVVIAIVLLIATPIIFDILNGFQSSIIESNAIPKLVLSDEMMEAAQIEDNAFWTMNNIGNVFMNNVFLLFFRYDNVTFGHFIWQLISSSKHNIITDLGNAVFGTVNGAYNAVREGSPIITLLPYTNSSSIYYEYPILSGIVGLVFCYYFIKIAISVGIRMFKLFALQVIAPIPIVLSMNPTQGIVLKNYFNYLVKTYADLFIRLACIMLVYPVIITLTDEIIPESGNLVINLVLIIALLKFAKEFPKILSEILNLNTKFSDNGPGGFLGGLFGTGVGLASGAIVSKNVGLEGKDFALHTLATGFKGGVSGHKGGQQGVVGFGKSVIGGTANSYVDATQIYSTGGYGNWLKAQMYEKTGQSRIFAQQREKLSDAVTNTNQHYDSLVQQQKRVGGLKKIAQDLYNEANDGGIKNSFKYQAALQRKSDALKNYSTADTDLQRERIKLEYNKAVADLQGMDSDYDKAVADFYNNASVNSTIPQAVTLASIKDQIIEESTNVDSTFDLSKYENIDGVATGYNSYVIAAREERDQAVQDLRDFKNRKEVQLANGKLERDNKYTSNRNAQQGRGQTGGGQQGQGQTGGGQQGQGQTGGGQQGQGQTGGGQQGQGQTGGGQQGPNN